jgi:hypothetical protein
LRLVAAILESLLGALAFHPVRDLVRRVDRMSIRSLLTRCRDALQPDSAWTINWMRLAPTSIAEQRTIALARHGPLGSNDKPLSRAPGIVESPMPRTRAEHDETRAIDQRRAARNARRDSGGRRAS